MGVAGVFWGVSRLPQTDLFQWTILAESKLIHGSRIQRVGFLDKENGVIVGTSFIARSNDGGKEWNVVHAANENAYYSFAFYDAKNGIAVGSVHNRTPLALQTRDAGRSWQQLTLDRKVMDKSDETLSTFLDVCFDSNGKSWIVGDKGIISATVEANGLNVKSFHPTMDVLYSVACADNGQVWTAGQSTVLSGANSWQAHHFARSYYFGKVKVIEKDIWILGAENREAHSQGDLGVVLRSRNSGLSWENKTPSSRAIFYDIIKSGNSLWLIGSGGQILRSPDNGDSWITVPSPTTADLLSVHFVDARSGWITGDRGTVLGLKR